jgi:hypothetical protein
LDKKFMTWVLNSSHFNNPFTLVVFGRLEFHPIRLSILKPFKHVYDTWQYIYIIMYSEARPKTLNPKCLDYLFLLHFVVARFAHSHWLIMRHFANLEIWDLPKSCSEREFQYFLFFKKINFLFLFFGGTIPLLLICDNWHNCFFGPISIALCFQY